jgi:hypothetical protein
VSSLSIASWIDGSGESCPKRCAYNWSIETPAWMSGAECLLRLRRSQVGRRLAIVVAADLVVGERFGHPAVGVTDDREVLAPRLERLQARRA